MHNYLNKDDFHSQLDLEETYNLINRGLHTVNDQIIVNIGPHLFRKSLLRDLLVRHLQTYSLNFGGFFAENHILKLKEIIARTGEISSLELIKTELKNLDHEIRQSISRNEDAIKESSRLLEISGFYGNLIAFSELCIEKCQVEFHSGGKVVLQGCSLEKPKFVLSLSCNEMDISVFFKLFPKRKLIFESNAKLDLIRLAQITNTFQYDLKQSLIDMFEKGNGLTDVYIKSLMLFWSRSLNRLHHIDCIDDLK